jgi:hypothetical protein
MKKVFLLLLLLLTGCAAINSVSFHNMSTSYRDLVEQHNNDNILVNIVRSSKTLPVSFMDISSVYGNGYVSPNMNIGANFSPTNPQSLGGIFSGQSSSTNISMGINVSSGFTFTQNSLDNSTFMSSFLAPVGKEFLEFRGTTEFIPKELYLTLLLESIELKSEDSSKLIKLINNPLDPNFLHFQSFLEMLIDSQMQLEDMPSKSVGEPNARRICINRYAAKDIFGDLIAATEFCTKSSKTTFRRRDYQRELIYLNSIRDGSSNFSLAFKVRSLGNIFDYLGLVLRAQNSEKNPFMVTVEQSEQRKLLSLSPQSRVPLFVVKKNQSVSNPISSVMYRNDSYEIEDEDVTFTKQVMEFISILLTFSKSPGLLQGPTPSYQVGR